MNALRPLIRLAPITADLTQRNPKILLGGKHQPTLLRYLDGWPRRTGRPSAFLIQFVEDGDSPLRALRPTASTWPSFRRPVPATRAK
ncbi:hypothetical protein QF039_001117 [Pseudomonas sp. W2I6]|nr:hypothetical protein [Pseudomonas sp. W2I6]